MAGNRVYLRETNDTGGEGPADLGFQQLLAGDSKLLAGDSYFRKVVLTFSQASLPSLWMQTVAVEFGIRVQTVPN